MATVASQGIGARVRYWRTRRQLRAQEAAERAGVAPETWSRIENGRFQPRADTLSKIAAALEVDPALLMRDPPDGPVDDDAAADEAILRLLRRCRTDVERADLLRAVRLISRSPSFLHAMNREEAGTLVVV